MITLRETIRALYGAYRLAHFDARGMDYFDASAGGAIRSFSAAVLVAPFYAVLAGLRFAAGRAATHPLRYVLVETVAYVIAWVAFPVVMATVCKAIDRDGHFLRFVCAYNWAAVLQNAVYLPLAMLAVSGVVPPDLAGAIGVITLSAILVYTWFVARTALGVAGGMAAGIVALDFALSLVINAFAEGRL